MLDASGNTSGTTVLPEVPLQDPPSVVPYQEPEQWHNMHLDQGQQEPPCTGLPSEVPSQDRLSVVPSLEAYQVVLEEVPYQVVLEEVPYQARH